MCEILKALATALCFQQFDLERVVWEEVLWETTPVSVFCITRAQSLAISLPAPQLSLFVYLIYWQMPKRNRCCVLVPLFYSNSPAKKKRVELSECIMVIYGNHTLKVSFATKQVASQLSWGKGRGAERENELMWFRWTDPKVWSLNMGFFCPAVCSQ